MMLTGLSETLQLIGQGPCACTCPDAAPAPDNLAAARSGRLLPSPAIGGIVHRKRLRYFYFWEDQMKQFITAGLTLAAICSGCGNSLAYINYPWCVFGESRGTDCSYRSKEECTHSGRSRGFGVSAAKIPATIPNCLTSLSNQRSDGQAMCQGRFGKKHRGLLPPVSNADRC